MDERTRDDLAREDTLEVPDPVAFNLERSGRRGPVKVVTDRPPPVRTHRPRTPVVVKVR